MTDFSKLPTNQLLLKAAEALDDAYDKLTGVTPEQYALIGALQERSQNVFEEGALTAKDVFDPGKG